MCVCVPCQAGISFNGLRRASSYYMPVFVCTSFIAGRDFALIKAFFLSWKHDWKAYIRKTDALPYPVVTAKYCG